jgi:2-phospho-L-lactate guanylyltransferase
VNAVLLPVKRFANSKHRLAGLLSPEQRQQLARAMFEDVWQTVTSWIGSGGSDVERLLVITEEPEVLERCRQAPAALKVLGIAEQAPVSHTESTRQGTAHAIGMGVRTLISVPIDTPAVTGEDLSELVELSRQYEVVVVPSGDGTGTNALVRTPPDAITAHFGPDSCRRHIEDAQTNFQKYRLRRLPNLAADIDTPEEARQFLELMSSTGRDCGTARLLRDFLR